jgi:hypothetical protein
MVWELKSEAGPIIHPLSEIYIILQPFILLPVRKVLPLKAGTVRHHI